LSFSAGPAVYPLAVRQLQRFQWFTKALQRCCGVRPKLFGTCFKTKQRVNPLNTNSFKKLTFWAELLGGTRLAIGSYDRSYLWRQLLAQKRIFAALGIIGGLLLVQACGRQMPSQPACNFVENSDLQRVSWKTDLPVTMYLDASIPYDYVPAIQNAMAVWNNIGQKTIKQNFFVLGSGNPGSPTPKVDGYNKIYLLNSWESDLSDQQARTTVYWSGARIYEADMRLDAANFSFYTDNSNPDPTKVNLESLVLHELGHVLGLAHNPVSTSVMQPSLANGTLRVDPGEIDVQSITCEY